MGHKDLQVREKQELQTEAEQTRAGATFLPAVDIFESEAEITLLADMPGVTSDQVAIDLHEGQLTITGKVGTQGSDKETYLLREYETGSFHRQFTLSDRIDQSKISAAMTDGVLRLILPKAEKPKPRKIEVTSG